MKNSINKYLYRTGLAIAASYAIYIILTGLFEKPKYLLLVYNRTINYDVPIEGLEDPKHRINIVTNGMPEIEERVNISSAPLYVLIREKKHDIEFVTDKIDKLNDFLKYEIR
ncbi:hypothetical protein [Paenibacillus glycanilyticus]|uniref:Uncharacterized protein n=1 Tax=Paenibacillus glycanilyticus TaxID=126569 RepID=A0ABQ6G7N2_9BACL|nr:hypothetical protein [Paenibacillus glycanilyticus]GLX66597.1 hypothetical protein MU1_09410 [Paenibacillus glycanilyticus]